MDSDDRQIGRILSRREVLAILGAGGAGMLATRLGAQVGLTGNPQPAAPVGYLPACIVTPEQTEGPYFVDEMLNRFDIRSDPASGTVSEGAPLGLEMRVFRVNAGSCEPLPGAMVDVWQCDALGVYSDVRDTNGFFTTTGRKFLRGYQVTDASGIARFTTVYPGWYEGRCVHIHFKVRATVAGRAREFTSQLYFDDAFTDGVHTSAPYTTKAGPRVRNERDGIFRRGGRQLLMTVAEREGGYQGSFDIGLAV
jgi:protocatechuate 3,4-dioxygenase beta subunit